MNKPHRRAEAYIRRRFNKPPKEFCKCGKVIYRTWEDANTEKGKKNQNGVPRRVYKCKYADYFHITSQV